MSITMRQLLHMYVAERPLLKPQTLVGLEAAVRSFEKRFGGVMDVALSFEMHHAAAWRVHCRKLKPRTYNGQTNQLKALLRLGIKRDLIAHRHPFLMLEPSKVPRRAAPIVRESTIRKIEDFFATTQHDPLELGYTLMRPRHLWRAIFVTLVLTGMRRTATVSLTWGDVRFEEKSIRLRAEFSKTGREQTVPMADALVQELTMLAERNRAARGRSVHDTDRLFDVQAYGKPEPLTPSKITDGFRQLGRIVDCHLHPHLFRHTAASRWMDGKGNIKATQLILGHTSTLMSYEYVHPELDSMRDALAALT